MEAEVPRLRNSRGAQVADRARVRADRARARADVARIRAQKTAQKTAADLAPLAKSAGEAVRQGADEVAAWAGPQVRKTRSWAAPRIERTGVVVQEKIAPQVSEALTRAARKLDPEPAKRRKGLRRVLALALAGAGAAVAVLVIRSRSGNAETEPDYSDPEDAVTSLPVPPADSDVPPTGPAETSRVDANGHIRSTP
jgi:hypothetical protein